MKDDDNDDDDDQFGSQHFETTTLWRLGCVTKKHNCYVNSNAKNEHFPSLHPLSHGLIDFRFSGHFGWRVHVQIMNLAKGVRLLYRNL